MHECLIKKEKFVFEKKTDIKKDYVLLKEIGSGAYGVVYKGRHKRTGKEVAIKEIK